MNERDRLNLYDRLGEVLGPHEAGTLMELLPPNGWDDIATKESVAATASMLRGEMAEVRGEMAEVRGEMAEVRGEIAGVRSEVSELRSEMLGGFADLRVEMASMQRTTLIALAGFMLTIWLTLILAA